MSIRRSRRSAIFALVVVAAALTGCGQSHVATAPVQGSVTVDGKRLSQGRIMLAPIPSNDQQDPGPAAYGVIQPDGAFVLSTFDDGDGAVVGKHWITLYGEGPQTSQPLPGAPAGAASAQPPGWPVDVPKFKKMKLPREPFVVSAAGSNQLDIVLTSEEIRKYGEQDD